MTATPHSNLDRVLDLIDEGLAACPATGNENLSWAPPGSDNPDICWRCTDAPPDGPAGLCAACRSVLADDDYTTGVHSEPDWAALLGRHEIVRSVPEMMMEVPNGHWVMCSDGLREHGGEGRFLPWPEGHVRTEPGGQTVVHDLLIRNAAEGGDYAINRIFPSFHGLVTHGDGRVDEPIPDEQWADHGIHWPHRAVPPVDYSGWVTHLEHLANADQVHRGLIPDDRLPGLRYG